MSFLIVDSIAFVFYDCFQTIFVCVHKLLACLLWDVCPLFLCESLKLGQVGFLAITLVFK